MEYKYGNVDEKVIYCPLTGKPCKENKCAWWNTEDNCCVVNALLYWVKP